METSLDVSLRATAGSEAIPSIVGWRLLRRYAPRNDKQKAYLSTKNFR
jgi:hypothetical protein